MVAMGRGVEMTKHLMRDQENPVQRVLNRLKEMDDFMDAAMPLAKVCSQIAEGMDIEDCPAAGRYIHLPVKKYRKAHDKGVQKCFGLRIHWIK